MAINTKAVSTFTTAVLIGDAGVNPASPPDSVPTLTKVGGLPVAAALELQSIKGALVLPRMTTAQINGLANANTAVTDGMIAYNTDLGSVVSRSNGQWSQGFASVESTITNAEILGMFAAPVQILPAPGAGKIILVNTAFLQLNYTAPQFNAGGQIVLQYGNAANAGGPLAARCNGNGAAINATNASQTFGFAGGVTFGPVVSATAANQGLFLTNDTAAFAAGGSSFTLTVFYTILTV